jgi:hypothetical protein
MSVSRPHPPALVAHHDARAQRMEGGDDRMKREGWAGCKKRLRYCALRCRSRIQRLPQDSALVITAASTLLKMVGYLSGLSSPLVTESMTRAGFSPTSMQIVWTGAGCLDQDHGRKVSGIASQHSPRGMISRMPATVSSAALASVSLLAGQADSRRRAGLEAG